MATCLWAHRLTHAHTIIPPTAGVRQVGHTSKKAMYMHAPKQRTRMATGIKGGTGSSNIILCLEFGEWCEDKMRKNCRRNKITNLEAKSKAVSSVIHRIDSTVD